MVNCPVSLMIGEPLVELQREQTIGSAEHEIKYVVPAGAAAPLRAWIPSVCRSDPQHPPGPVWTVYFDTPGLAWLSEKIDSDYLKTKVRVRWYGATGGHASPVFAEVKQRIGNRRVKARVTVEVSADDLAGWALCDERWTALLAGLRTEVPTLPGRLAPILKLAYTRYRYLDRGLAARVTLDSDIAAIDVNTTMVAGQVPVGIDGAVLELKGPFYDLPPHLHPVLRFGARRQAFSKYLACYQAVTGLAL